MILKTGKSLRKCFNFDENNFRWSVMSFEIEDIMPCFFLKNIFIYFERERERERTQVGKGVERERQSPTGSML